MKRGMNRNEVKKLIEVMSRRILSNVYIIEGNRSKKINVPYGDLFGMSKSREVTFSPSAVRRIKNAVVDSKVFFNGEIAIVALCGTKFQWINDGWVIDAGGANFNCETLQWSKK
ncbi:MAG: hypothetical protein ACRCX2_20790 [Paraclostridium sp.]